MIKGLNFKEDQYLVSHESLEKAALLATKTCHGITNRIYA